MRQNTARRFACSPHMRSFRVAMNQALSDYYGGHELARGLEFWKLDGLEMKMLRRLLVAMMAAGVVIAGPIPATLAQTPAPQRAVLAPLRMQLRDEIARMTSSQTERDRGPYDARGDPRRAHQHGLQRRSIIRT